MPQPCASAYRSLKLRCLKLCAYTLAVKIEHGSPFLKIAGESTRSTQPRSEASAARLPFDFVAKAFSGKRIRIT